MSSVYDEGGNPNQDGIHTSKDMIRRREKDGTVSTVDWSKPTVLSQKTYTWNERGEVIDPVTGYPETMSQMAIDKRQGELRAQKQTISGDCYSNTDNLWSVVNNIDNALRQITKDHIEPKITPEQYLQYLQADSEYRNSFIENYRHGGMSNNAVSLVLYLQRIREGVQPYLTLLDELEIMLVKDEQMRQRRNER